MRMSDAVWQRISRWWAELNASAAGPEGGASGPLLPQTVHVSAQLRYAGLLRLRAVSVAAVLLFSLGVPLWYAVGSVTLERARLAPEAEMQARALRHFLLEHPDRHETLANQLAEAVRSAAQ